jgi:hypothetical protein
LNTSFASFIIFLIGTASSVIVSGRWTSGFLKDLAGNAFCGAAVLEASVVLMVVLGVLDRSSNAQALLPRSLALNSPHRQDERPAADDDDQSSVAAPSSVLFSQFELRPCKARDSEAERGTTGTSLARPVARDIIVSDLLGNCTEEFDFANICRMES